jgi:hypothetical protein
MLRKILDLRNISTLVLVLFGFVSSVDAGDEERRSYAQTIFVQHPELFPEDRRQSVLDGVVLIGMTPFEAKLAGGAFAYKVVADKAKWPEHSDPFKVMWAQSMQADNSKIWMTFKNNSQFFEGGETAFRVHFEHGRAVEIEKI